MTSFITVPLTTDPADLTQEAFDYLTSSIPGWLPSEGNLEVREIEAVARIAAELADVASAVPAAIFRYFGQSIMGIPPINPAAASAGSTWTMIDTQGYTIRQGTHVGIPASGSSLLGFTVAADVVVPPGSSATAAGAVILVASDVGSQGNGLAGPAQLIDALAFVTAVTLPAVTSGGVDGETDEQYLARLVDQLRAPGRPVLPVDFAINAKAIAGVSRAVAIDGYQPGTSFTATTSSTVTPTVLTSVSSTVGLVNGMPLTQAGIPGGTTIIGTTINTVTMSAAATATASGVTVTAGAVMGQARTVAVASVDQNGAAVSSPIKTLVSSTLQAQREADFVVNAIDPTFTTVNSTFAVIAQPGADLTAVDVAVVAAVTAFLNPATYGVPPGGDPLAWNNEPVIYLRDVNAVVKNVLGVRHVTAVTLAGSSTADLTLTGVAPLPQAGTITGTVTAST